MKKFYPCVVFLLFVSAVSFGQSKSFGPGKFNFGADGSEVVGTYSDTYTYGLSFSLKYEVPVNKNLYGTISTGYEAIFTNSDSVTSSAYKFKSSYGFLPSYVGLKYCYKTHFFVEGQLGIVLPTDQGASNSPGHETLTETTFTYAFGIGYTVLHGFEAGIRYESWDEGVAFNQVALRLAYRFGSYHTKTIKARQP